MKKTLTGSTFAKITAFFLLAISYIIGCIGVLATVIMIEGEVYTYGGNTDSLVRNFMDNQALADYRSIITGKNHNGCVLNNPAWISDYCQNSNLNVKIVSDEDELVYISYRGREKAVEDTSFTYLHIFSAHLEEGIENHQSRWQFGRVDQYEDGPVILSQHDYFMFLYVDPEFPVNDRYKDLANQAYSFYKLRYVAPVVALVSLLFFLICFIFLMCAAGHHNNKADGKGEITPSLLNGVPTDLFTVFYVITAFTGIGLGASFCDGLVEIAVAVLLVFGVVEIIWGTIFCMECAIRLKLHTFWKNTIICVVYRFLRKLLRILWRGTVSLLKGIPFIMDILTVFLGICILEFFMLLLWGEAELVVLWMLEKAVMLPAVVYFALVCRQLKKGSAELAAGNLQYKLNTSHMILDFKEQGENLNQIAQGINTAVEQRMKSEHLKTELITNVSHDLKTPLTSIINYADLIASQTDDSEKIAEYSQVLLRQSKRLKKLLDDLMEASKATTGNLEVTLQPCELAVLLTQAVGEYEQRFEEKGLCLITRQPEGQIRVMADGRHLWRVFDNLLGNICKYALEGSRVYLTVEPKDDKVNIIFRNMSKYVLEVTGEELEERFVRGDKSRHMEGNGLGLSIAKSLMGLQGGEMEIITDGDLFKVVLTFSVL